MRRASQVVGVTRRPRLGRRRLARVTRHTSIDLVARCRVPSVISMTGRRGNGWPFVTVADNGPGVADENRHHLFEPHFTTKESGTGIGLFMSYGVVREHQGSLSYEGSKRGAVFTVILPPYPR